MRNRGADLLAAYTVVDGTYATGAAGDIICGPAGVTDIRANKNQAAGRQVNGDHTVHAFADTAGDLRLILAPCSRPAGGSPIAAAIELYDPATKPWSHAGTAPAVNSLHGAAAAGRYLYLLDYHGGAIVTLDLAGEAFIVAGTMPFPAFFNAVEGPGRPPLAPAGQQHNGVALRQVGDSLLALFTTMDESGGTFVYQASTLVRLRFEPATGALRYTAGDYVKVGKNALALEPFAFTFTNTVCNNIYIPCGGGPQRFGRHNPDSCLDIVDLNTMTCRTAFQAGPADGAGDQFDFRDIVIGNRGDTYILVGHYNADYATFRGRVYKTTAAVLQLQVQSASPPARLSQVAETVDEMAAAPGFFWALLYEDALPVNNDRLWFVRGNQIDLYNPPPDSPGDAPFRTLTPAADLGLAHIHSLTPLWPPPLTRSTPGRSPRPLAAQARLARQARAAALKARGELRTEADNKSV